MNVYKEEIEHARWREIMRRACWKIAIIVLIAEFFILIIYNSFGLMQVQIWKFAIDYVLVPSSINFAITIIGG